MVENAKKYSSQKLPTNEFSGIAQNVQAPLDCFSVSSHEYFQIYVEILGDYCAKQHYIVGTVSTYMYNTYSMYGKMCKLLVIYQEVSPSLCDFDQDPFFI